MSKHINLKQTDSTNRVAKQLAKAGADEWTVVTARKQTNGRGRMDRSFFSFDRYGIYMSIILRPKRNDPVNVLTAMAAVAVSRAIETVTRLNTGIKWVNDVYISNRKVSGILAEGEFTADGTPEYIVLGIGVNVSVTNFPEDISNKATSLAIELDKEGRGVDNLFFVVRNLYLRNIRKRIINQVVTELRAMYYSEDSEILEEYIRKSCVIGKELDVYNICERDGEKPLYTAKATSVDREFRLIVTDSEGTSHVLDSGEVCIKQGSKS